MTPTHPGYLTRGPSSSFLRRPTSRPRWGCRRLGPRWAEQLLSRREYLTVWPDLQKFRHFGKIKKPFWYLKNSLWLLWFEIRKSMSECRLREDKIARIFNLQTLKILVQNWLDAFAVAFTHYIRFRVGKSPLEIYLKLTWIFLSLNWADKQLFQKPSNKNLIFQPPYEKYHPEVIILT